MFEQITPVILTLNEAANIGRTLAQLQWAQDIVVVDSLSDDDTLDIVARSPQARVFKRKFVSLEDQWTFALRETAITTEWVLALDADYVLTPGVVKEIALIKPPDELAGYRARFVYCVHGRPLRGSAYPPVVVLYRHRLARYRQDGHAHRVVVDGAIADLRSPILHDDRKSLERWVVAQLSYSALELNRLGDAKRLRWRDRLRRLGVMPLLIGLYAYCKAGGPFRGAAAARYAYERATFECLLALRWLTERLEREDKD